MIPTSELPAVRAAVEAGVAHRVVTFEPAPDVATAAARRGIAVDRVLKTMVVRVGAGEYVLVLVPGDRTIDWKALRAVLGRRRITMASAEEARRATGYERGTITPFGAGSWPVVVDASVTGGGEVSVGGGAPGVAIHLDADDLVAAVEATVAPIASSR